MIKIQRKPKGVVIMNKHLFLSALPYAFIGLCLVGVLLMLVLPSASGGVLVA